MVSLNTLDPDAVSLILSCLGFEEQSALCCVSSAIYGSICTAAGPHDTAPDVLSLNAWLPPRIVPRLVIGLCASPLRFRVHSAQITLDDDPTPPLHLHPQGGRMVPVMDTSERRRRLGSEFYVPLLMLSTRLSHLMGLHLTLHANHWGTLALPQLQELTLEIYPPQGSGPLARRIRGFEGRTISMPRFLRFLDRSLAQCPQIRCLAIDFHHNLLAPHAPVVLEHHRKYAVTTQLFILQRIRSRLPLLNILAFVVILEERTIRLLRSMPLLEQFYVDDGCTWTADWLQQLTDPEPLGGLQHLQEVAMKNLKLTAGMAASLSYLPALLRLEPSRWECDDPGVALLHLPQLRELHLYCTPSTVNVSLAVAALAACTRLQSLHLSHDELTDELLGGVLPHLTELHTLNLSDCHSLETLECLIHDVSPLLPLTLQRLQFSTCALFSTELTKLLRYRPQMSLVLSHTLVTGEEISASTLSQLRRHFGQHFSLDQNMIDGFAGAHSTSANLFESFLLEKASERILSGPRIMGGQRMIYHFDGEVNRRQPQEDSSFSFISHFEPLGRSSPP